MSWVHRTMIVPHAYRSLAQQLCAGLAGPSGEGMFGVDLGTTPSGPTTHGMSTGLIQPQFAGLMPLDVWDEGAAAYTRLDPGQAEQIVAGAAALGAALPFATVEALLAAVRAADEPWPVCCEHLGLVQVRPESPTP